MLLVSPFINENRRLYRDFLLFVYFIAFLRKMTTQKKNFLFYFFICSNPKVCILFFISLKSIIKHVQTNIIEPVEHNSPMLPPNFEFLVYEAMVEEDEEIPDEIKWMLE